MSPVTKKNRDVQASISAVYKAGSGKPVPTKKPIEFRRFFVEIKIEVE